MIVPGNEPRNAGVTPLYNPLRKPSCRNIVEYDEDSEVYFGGMCGSPCCRVFTVSIECMRRSPVVPPMPPASMHYAEIRMDLLMTATIYPRNSISNVCLHASMVGEPYRPPSLPFPSSWAALSFSPPAIRYPHDYFHQSCLP